MKTFGKKIEKESLAQDIMDMFQPVEGYNVVYYGKTRNGKTRTATADILELLKRGEVVYANWKIEFPEYDERKDKKSVFYKMLFGRRYFFKYNKDNLFYIDPDELISGKGDINISYLNKLVGVHIFIDEGQWVLPSLDRVMSEELLDKMKLVLHGGHYCRSLNIITQRPSNISKNTRSQINIWYRCVKRLEFGRLMIFQRWAIEDMKDDMPVEFYKDEDGSERPAGDCKTYFVNKIDDPVFMAYNTHAMRSGDAIDQPPSFDVFELSRWDMLKQLLWLLFPTFLRGREQSNVVAALPARVRQKPLKDYLNNKI